MLGVSKKLGGSRGGGERHLTPSPYCLCFALSRNVPLVQDQLGKERKRLARQAKSTKTGDLKTLIMTPGPRTPTTDQVRGLPTDRSTDYPYGPIYGPPAK